MTWYADLGPLDYFEGSTATSWRAVGWLGEDHPYAQGEVSARFFERLCSLLLDPWQPAMFLGGHACELCPWEVSPGPDPGGTFSSLERRRRVLGVRRKSEPISIDGQLVEMGTANLWIPGDGCVYVAPSLIAHYIRAHRYAPPQTFVEAVLRCPDIHTEEYRKASRDLPEDDFVEWLKTCPDPRTEAYRDALRASGAPELADWVAWWRQRDQAFKGPR